MPVKLHCTWSAISTINLLGGRGGHLQVRIIIISNIMGDKLLLNFGAKFQR